MFLTWLIVWWLVGFISLANQIREDLYEYAVDIVVRDAIFIFFLSFLGPILLIVRLKDYLNKYDFWNKVLIKHRVK